MPHSEEYFPSIKKNTPLKNSSTPVSDLLSEEIDRPLILEGRFSFLQKMFRILGIAKELSS